MNRRNFMLGVALGCGMTAFAEPLPPLPAEEDCFTIATFGDTQEYADNGDETVSNPSFSSRVNWLSEESNISAQNILFVSHLGDIVNTRTKNSEWVFADAQMRRLEGIVPYAICPGNHDLSSKGASPEFQQWFPASRFSSNPWYGGSFAGLESGVFGNNANSYQLLSWKGHDYVIFHLQCNAGKAVLDWMGDLLSGTLSNRKAIVVTHMYLGAVRRDIEGPSGEFSQRLIRRMQWGKISDNESLNPTEAWNYCFRKHKNLILILSGDQSAALACHRTAVGLHGNVVHEIVTDYPHADDSDWIRLYRIFPESNNRIEVYTYSPQRNALCESAGYCTDPKFHRFSMEFGNENGTVRDVLVRQEWPWNDRLRVDYTLEGQGTDRYDVLVSASLGGQAVEIPVEALSGDVDRVGSGGHTLFIDVTRLALPVPEVDGLKVLLDTVVSAPDEEDPDDEVLYRIVSLRGDKLVRDLTRRDILTGLWGPYVSTKDEYNAWADGSVKTDVLIWTGVTNDLYKTEYMVFRKIPAGTFPFTTEKIPTQISQPFWISVFELTQGQYAKAHEFAAKLGYGKNYCESWFTNGTCAATRPVDHLMWDDICGSGYRNWPESGEIPESRVIGNLRLATGLQAMTLPTHAQWEYACHGGNEAKDYGNGRDHTTANAGIRLAPIARWKGNSGWTATYTTKWTYVRDADKGEVPDRNCLTDEGTAPVGSYAANSWGIYDMHGNVGEWMLDRETSIETLQEMAEAAGGTLSDPLGDPKGDKKKRMVATSYWHAGASSHKATQCEAIACSGYAEDGCDGCRLVLPDSTAIGEDGTFSEPTTVYTNPDHVQRWCTVKSGEALAAPFEWPEGSVRLDVEVSDSMGASVVTASVNRVELAKQGEIVVSFPEVGMKSDERVYSFVFRFRASNGGAIVLERTALMGSVLGYGSETGVRVRQKSARSRWRKADVVNVLSLQYGDEPLTIDGEEVETGLNHTAGWYEWRPVEERMFLVGDAGHAAAEVKFGESGMIILLK